MNAVSGTSQRPDQGFREGQLPLSDSERPQVLQGVEAPRALRTPSTEFGEWLFAAFLTADLRARREDAFLTWYGRVT